MFNNSYEKLFFKFHFFQKFKIYLYDGTFVKKVALKKIIVFINNIRNRKKYEVKFYNHYNFNRHIL